MWDKIVKGLAAAGGAGLGWVGGWNVMLTVLAVAMVVDYLTGLIVAACGKSQKTEGGGLSSKVGFVGLAKKGFILLIVLLATALDKAIGNQTMVFQMASAGYYIANEGLSVVENAALLGVPFPGGLKKALDELKQSGDEEGRMD